jgi:hypothetical protein
VISWLVRKNVDASSSRPPQIPLKVPRAARTPPPTLPFLHINLSNSARAKPSIQGRNLGADPKAHTLWDTKGRRSYSSRRFSGSRNSPDVGESFGDAASAGGRQRVVGDGDLGDALRTVNGPSHFFWNIFARRAPESARLPAKTDVFRRRWPVRRRVFQNRTEGRETGPIPGVGGGPRPERGARRSPPPAEGYLDTGERPVAPARPAAPALRRRNLSPRNPNPGNPNPGSLKPGSGSRGAPPFHRRLPPPPGGACRRNAATLVGCLAVTLRPRRRLGRLRDEGLVLQCTRRLASASGEDGRA